MGEDLGANSLSGITSKSRQIEADHKHPKFFSRSGNLISFDQTKLKGRPGTSSLERLEGGFDRLSQSTAARCGAGCESADQNF